MDTTLITGATSGIGYELAKICALNGHDLVLASRKLDEMEAIKEDFENSYGINVYVVSVDLTKGNAPQKLYDYCQEQGLVIDNLINNAGFGDFGFFVERDLRKQIDMIKLNVIALTSLCHLFGEEMSERGAGRIMNVASIAAFQAGPLMSVYYATKAYVLSFSEGLAEELKRKKVNVTVLCPGPTNSGFVSSSDLADSGLFKNLSVDTAKDVAEYGYKSMIRGKVVAIYGFKNIALITLSRFVPRTFTRNLIYQIQK